MKTIRTLLLLVACALPAGFAQELFIGATLGTPIQTDDDFVVGAQFGLNFLPSFGLRAAVEGDVASADLQLASLDALYSFYLPMSPNSIYLGAGADLFNPSQLASVDDLQDGVFGAHAVAGAEFRLARFGLFGELQPGYMLGEDFSDEDAYYLRAKGGVNFHF